MKKLTLLICIMLIAASGFAQWNLISNQDTLIRYYDVAITPDSTVFVCGRDSFSGILIRSQDLGSTWDTTTFSDECYDISFPTNSIGYAKVYPGNLYKTIDGGNSWILIYDSLIASPSGDLLFINQDTGFSSYQDGGAGFFRTFDGGITWNQIIDTSLSDGLKNIGGRKMVFNNGNLYNTGGDFYLKSSDYGDHWQAFINDSIINSNNTISVWNDSIWLAGMGAGGIHFNHGIICRPTNGGLPWNFIDYQQFVFFQDMEMISSLKGYLVGIVYDYDYAFMKTIDGGNSWCRQQWTGNNLYGFYLNALDCINDSLCFAVGLNGSIFKTTNGGGQLLDQHTSEIKNEISFKLFPNPTTNNLTIETLARAIIEIIDIEGQTIKTINTAEKQTSIDVSDLSSGVYIIKAKTERGVVVKNFIKE